MTDNPSEYEADEQRWAALMMDAQRGDETRYRLLLTELSRMIHRYLVSRLGPHEFIEDCVQDILLAVHHGRHTYQPQRPFRPWLFAIVRNRSVDFLRRRRAFTRARDEASQESARQESATEFNPILAVEHSVMQGRLIEALDPPFRQAIVLTKLFGYSNAEVANQLSISEAAVKVRVHRGMSRLRNLFEADEL